MGFDRFSFFLYLQEKELPVNDEVEYTAENIERASKLTSVYSTWKGCDEITDCKIR